MTVLLKDKCRTPPTVTYHREVVKRYGRDSGMPGSGVREITGSRLLSRFGDSAPIQADKHTHPLRVKEGK